MPGEQVVVSVTEVRKNYLRAEAIEVEVDGTGVRTVTTHPPGPPADAVVTEVAAGRTWTVPAGGFWQVHPGAADVLVSAVDAFTTVQDGERCLDLYAGAGLFAG